ncbi:MAG: amidohydrolase family protein [Longimicrobiales bacterium]|nr:amidohydrolase family protein [Longimicrobiales bacterium]
MTMKRSLMAGVAAGVVLLGAPLDTEAQVRRTTPPQTQAVAITGATIHTVSNGLIENGTIVFEDGVITAVGADVEVPSGARVVNGTGKHIFPGLIDAWSTVGIEEIGAVDVSNDTNELGDFNPNVRAELAVNAESRHIGTTRTSGVLVTLTSPGGGLVSGMSSAMQMEGWTWEEMSLEGEAALNVNWPNPRPGRGRFAGFPGFGGRNDADRPTYEEQVQKLRTFFADARAYRDAKAAGERVRSDSRFEAMIPVIDGEIPVIVAADGISQINDAINWSVDEGIEIVIRGGADAIHVADRLVANDIPVILTATMSPPEREYEGYDAAYSRAAELYEAGVRFAISGGGGAAYTNRLAWEAGVAVAFGLPEREAIRAVTQNAAEIMGIGDRVGTLEPGKDATLLITTGNPLDTMTDIEQAYIQGREIDMMDIHRYFFEKYLAKIMQMRAVVM